MNSKKVSKNRVHHRSAETIIRLKDLLSGPWFKEGQQAYDYLRLKKPLRSFYRSRQPIDMEQFYKTLSVNERKRNREISRRLRLHWQSPVTEADFPLRDSFDEALTVLQLLELAVESGYLTLEDIWVPSRRFIIEMLWSPGARKFVCGYDYFLVERLSYRVGLLLGKSIVPDLPPAQTAPARFATFLSFHESWYGNCELDLWLGLLDDYSEVDDVEGLEVEDWDEAEAFEIYLRKREIPNQDILAAMTDVKERFQQRTAGAYWFTSRLGGFLSMLSEDELPIYASFYAYWLAKLFGYDLGDDGYEQVNSGWDHDLVKYMTDIGASRPELNILKRHLKLLEIAFQEVNATLSKSRKKRAVRQLQ